ncbi:MAG: helix-turn-helix domain-containing protein [Spartobacteria bacterium]
MISNLIDNPESKTLEFKRDLSSPRSVLRTLVAFANSAGGHLILGVVDDRKIIGVENPLDEEERQSNLIADSILPRLVPNIEMITVDGKTLLVVEVFLSGMRPHFLKAEGQQSGTYVRLGSTNRLADPQLIAELQRGVAGVSFDALPMPELTMDALDIKAIAKDFEGRNSIDERTLQSLRIMVKEQGKLVPSQGGILLYGLDRRQYFDDA